jgi:hypothetical protein
LLQMGLLCALVRQDPQEMAWIGGQAAIFVCVVFLLLLMCVLKGFLGFLARRAGEEVVREGMAWLFSSVNSNRGRYLIPRDSERASSSYP